MMDATRIIQPGESYTFRSYFEMPYEPEDILAAFGYRLRRKPLPLLTHAQLRIEYPLVVTEHLKGSLDYDLYGDDKLLVVEAKHADLFRGFTQLAVELIALDQWCDETQPVLPGAVSTGDIWQFGVLQRDEKLVTQVWQS